MRLSWPDLCAAYGANNGSMNSPQASAANVTRVTLRFLTPTMLRADGVQARRPAFGPIAKRLRDRINALSYFYCGKGLDIDFKGFGEQAEGIKTVADSTRWVESSRYSRRREVTHDLSGFVGEVSFEGDLDAVFAVSEARRVPARGQERSLRQRLVSRSITRSYEEHEGKKNISPRRHGARREEKQDLLLERWNFGTLKPFGVNL